MSGRIKPALRPDERGPLGLIDDWALRKQQEELVARLRREAIAEKREMAGIPLETAKWHKPKISRGSSNTRTQASSILKAEHVRSGCVTLENECQCGETISDGRIALGYRTCLSCGEKDARKETLEKSKAVVTMHKSNTVFVGSGESAKRYARDIAHMRRGEG